MNRIIEWFVILILVCSLEHAKVKFARAEVETDEANKEVVDEQYIYTHDTKSEEENVDVNQNSEGENDVSSVDTENAQLEVQVTAEGNSRVNGTNGGNNTSKIRCTLKTQPEGIVPEVKIMNLSSLLTALTPLPNITDGECAVVLFYSPWCIFSARAAPHFNALARVFPQISFYAIDAVQHTNLHMRYGLIAVPTILLFQNGRAVAKFNGSHSSLEKFSNFVSELTGISPEGALNVTSADMTGPVPAALQERTDYILILSWVFTIVCLCIWFLKSSLCHRIVESIKNTWREAEAQHEHEE
ncbi:thioredoxin domain-containing protein 15-like [Centruroides sculpturatus]|uniref:thioredoxin domain-containing protein 15-like n=2 Tax=Centruroides sculpturatus TaxID=218467 RepID=UPI000C6F0100|nr:thioredoxin domain-containing protein 15-like [Centruroides sculpturatus]XP_023219401.1 thioredoxin domain-containing protein 15-like [Centruroides sculpturatus]